MKAAVVFCVMSGAFGQHHGQGGISYDYNEPEFDPFVSCPAQIAQCSPSCMDRVYDVIDAHDDQLRYMAEMRCMENDQCRAVLMCSYEQMGQDWENNAPPPASTPAPTDALVPGLNAIQQNGNCEVYGDNNECARSLSYQNNEDCKFKFHNPVDPMNMMDIVFGDVFRIEGPHPQVSWKNPKFYKRRAAANP